jgi:hypothetical protein
MTCINKSSRDSLNLILSNLILSTSRIHPDFFQPALLMSNIEPVTPPILTPLPPFFTLPNSETVRDQLLRGLLGGAGDTSSLSAPFTEPLLRVIMERLESENGTDSLVSTFGPILSALLTPLTSATLLSDPGVTGHVAAIAMLMRAHKAAPLIMIDGVANFLLPPEGVPMPTINPMFPMLRGPPVMQVCLSSNDLV